MVSMVLQIGHNIYHVFLSMSSFGGFLAECLPCSDDLTICIFYRRLVVEDYDKLLIEDFNPFQSGFLGQCMR